MVNRFVQPYLIGLCICVAMLCASCIKTNRPRSTTAKVDSLSFIVLGDWGKKGGENQKAVADQMDVYSKKHHAQFIITTGDNFYVYGVANITDPHWKSSFEDIYNKEGHQITWYPTLGNHDYGLNPQAQVEYSSVSKRWTMPARYHALKKNINSSHAVMFAFTDTSPFVSEYHRQSMADLKMQDTAAQLSWLRQTLTASRETWKIVVGHHPIYSSGPHGNTPELIQRFKPLFLQTKTDFYLAGHDHSLEHVVQPNEPLQYLVSGGGSNAYYINSIPGSLFAKGSPGFLVMTLYVDKANMYFYNEKGVLLYQKEVLK